LPKKAADGSWERAELASNDKLRKQLLGRNWDKMSSQLSTSSDKQPGGSNSTKPRPQEARKRDITDDSDNDEGRSSLGQNKKKRTAQDQQDVDEISDSKQSNTRTQKSTRSHKTGSYLDEVLSLRKKKKKKKT
jgi:hypothetical protein